MRQLRIDTYILRGIDIILVHQQPNLAKMSKIRPTSYGARGGANAGGDRRQREVFTRPPYQARLFRA
jgi:hypothetical protein